MPWDAAAELRSALAKLRDADKRNRGETLTANEVRVLLISYDLFRYKTLAGPPGGIDP